MCAVSPAKTKAEVLQSLAALTLFWKLMRGNQFSSALDKGRQAWRHAGVRETEPGRGHACANCPWPMIYSAAGRRLYAPCSSLRGAPHGIMES